MTNLNVNSIGLTAEDIGPIKLFDFPFPDDLRDGRRERVVG